MSSQAAQAVAPSVGASSGSSASAGPSNHHHHHQQQSSGSHVSRAHAATPITSGTQHTSPGSPRHQGGSIDVEALIRSHGGDVRRTLEVVLGERNSLQAQNTQLWKLIEKQRAQCAHLAGDNDRLRADRERANSRLLAAGLEPVTTGSRRGVSHSSSAMTLASTTTSESHGPSAPVAVNQTRRHGSDHEDKASPMSAPAVVTTTPSARAAALDALNSGSERSGSPSGLLPSPMPEKRLRHESRMTFPPEVASFMALADTKEQSQPPGNLAPQNPEGSHSSSPGDSQRASPIMEQEEIVQGDSPRPSQDTVTSRPSTSPVGAPDSRPSIESTTLVSPVSPPQPDHTQLTPALLPHARLSIPHSTVFPNQSGRDVLCFIVAVTVRPPNSTTPLSWTVGKTFSAFMELDTRAQERSGKGRKEWKRMVSPLPEGKAWKDFAPSKIDQRKAALEAYLQSLLVAPVSDKSDLCTFLSTDVVQAKTNKLRKEGYLTKKGKNFGGWKTRYFVLEGPVMKYYESRGGAFLGSIQIVGAQIGRQNRSPDASDDRNFRHAFLIIEANGKKDSSQNRHVLCASSDLERDSWIDMLVRQVDPDLTPPTPAPQNGPPNPMSAGLGHQRRRSAIRKGSKDVIVTSAQPMSQLPDANAKFISGAPLPSVINLMESQRLQHAPSNSSISSQAQQSGTSQPAAAPPTVHLTPASVASTTDLLLPSEPTPKPLKRQSAMPVRQSFSPAYLTKLSSDGVSSVPGYNTDRERDRKAKSGRFWGFGKTPEKGTARPVFGVPLADSISIASVAGLPAIVFRCIEYLEAKHADQEEGIYRLSGSSAVIKGLKERFNQEGDVNLLQIDERWDPHAIAGLLKTYLRELPTSLLTRTLHMRFLAVIDLVDSTARVTELSRLVAELPPANYTLLRAFTAHLILIVKNSAVNKMTLRNIGIVFSPTLGIPAGIFYELVSRFGAIFDDEGVDELPLDEATAIAPAESASPGGTSTNLDDPSAPKNKRNSVLYHASGAETMLGLGGRALDPSAEDSQSELSLDDLESEPMSAQSSDNISIAAGGPEAASHNAATIRRRDIVREGVEALAQSHNGSPG